MPKRAIVNVSVGSWYPEGAKRLAVTLDEHGEDADRLFWTNCYPPHSPTHKSTPYAFKPFAFAAALMNGYEQVLWLDSSVMLCKPIDQIWEWTSQDGYCFGNDGWFVGQWCNDNVLGIMGLTRDEAWDIPLMDGKLIGLDLRSDVGRSFLRQWLEGAEQGLFRGSWSGPQAHRHDITVGSIIAHRLGMRLRTDFVTMGHCDGKTFVRAFGL